jgi:hypothetical protein
MNQPAFYRQLEVFLLTLVLLAESSFAFNPGCRDISIGLPHVLDHHRIITLSPSFDPSCGGQNFGNYNWRSFHLKRGFKLFATPDVQSQAPETKVENGKRIRYSHAIHGDAQLIIGSF